MSHCISNAILLLILLSHFSEGMRTVCISLHPAALSKLFRCVFSLFSHRAVKTSSMTVNSSSSLQWGLEWVSEVDRSIKTSAFQTSAFIMLKFSTPRGCVPFTLAHHYAYKSVSWKGSYLATHTPTHLKERIINSRSGLFTPWTVIKTYSLFQCGLGTDSHHSHSQYHKSVETRDVFVMALSKQ